MGVILDEGLDGPKIHEVVPESGAAKAGLQVNDMVTHLNGQRVATRDDLIRRVREFRPGEKVQLKLLRGGKEQTADVVLGELASCVAWASATISRTRWAARSASGAAGSRWPCSTIRY